MKRLIIAGAGGFGSEILQWVRDIPAGMRDWEIYGFIDNIRCGSTSDWFGIKIIDTIQDYTPQKNDVFTCALGNPVDKSKACRHLVEKGARFINIIHPTALIGKNCKLGNGLVICPYVVVTNNVTLGDFVTINILSGVGHNVVIEDFCTLSPHCDVTGYAYLEEGVFMGSHAFIIPQKRVGKYAKVGAGSVVIKNVKDYATVFGNPAVDVSGWK